MKPTLLKTSLLISVLFSLSACNNDQLVSQPEKDTNKEPQLVEPIALDDKLIPSGHWLVNSHFCQQKLPSQGVYDFKISHNKVTNIGITQDGKWYQFEESKFKKAVQESLSDEKFKCAGIDIANLIFARFEAVGTAINIAFEPGSKFLITQNQDAINLAVTFNQEILKNFEFIQIDDQSMDEEITEVEPQSAVENN